MIFLDIETTGLDPKRDALHGIGLLSESRSEYFRVGGEETIPGTVASLLANKDIPIIGHNVLDFDIPFLEAKGFTIKGKIFDTRHMAYLLDENNSSGLKELTVRYFGSEFLSNKGELDAILRETGCSHVGHLAAKDLLDPARPYQDIISKYCLEDLANTKQLFLLLKKKLDELDAKVKRVWPGRASPKDIFLKETVPFEDAKRRMQKQGLLVDRAKVESARQSLGEELAGLLESLREECSAQQESVAKYFSELTLEKKLAGLKTEAGKERLKSEPHRWTTEFSWTKAGHVLRLLTEEYGINDKLFLRTEKGGLALHKEGISHLLEHLELSNPAYPVIEKYSQLKRLSKLITTYVGTEEGGGISDFIDESTGRVYPKYGSFQVTGRLSASEPNCLSMDTEVLTRLGWKTGYEITLEDHVAAFDPQTQQIVWQRPTATYLSEVGPKQLVSVKNQHIDFIGTRDHRCLFQHRKTGVYKVLPAAEFQEDYKVLHGAMAEGSFELDQNWLRFLVAVQADGSIRKDCDVIDFVFSKERKVLRLLTTLKPLGADYKIAQKDKTKTRVTVYGIRQRVLNVLGEDKIFPLQFLQLSSRAREVFLEELFYWDGSYTRKQNYSTNSKRNIDIVQAIAALHGWRAHSRKYRSKSSTVDNYQLDFVRRSYSLTTNVRTAHYKETTRVWCLEVPTSFFLVRRGSDTLITGNCQNLPRVSPVKGFFVPPPGHVFLHFDASQIELRVAAHLSGDKEMIAAYNEGRDLHIQTAEAFFDEVVTKDSELRQVGKESNFLLIFKGSPNRLQTTLKVKAGKDYSLEQCRAFRDAYFERYPQYAAYLKDQLEFMKRYGVVFTETGRMRRLPDIGIGKYLNYKHREFKAPKEMLMEIKEYIHRNRIGEINNETIFNTASIRYSHATKQGFNFPIQGLAASIMKRGIIALDQAGYTVVTTVHDSVDVCVKKEVAIEAMKECERILSNCYRLKVPLIWEGKILCSLSESDRWRST